MILDADVVTAAKHFGLDPTLVQAVVQAEGDILKAVQCSLPHISTRADALDVLCRSAVHRMGDFIREQGHREAFVTYFGSKWAPLGATNDPHNLNANWVHNVLSAWRDA